MTATGAEAGRNLAPVVPAATTASQARQRPLRPVIAVVLALLSGLAAWLLLRHGIRTDDFPPFIAGQDVTPITRYSGPWLTAAAGMALVAALLLLTAATDLVRWSRANRQIA